MVGSPDGRTVTHHLTRLVPLPPDAALIGPVLSDFFQCWDRLRGERRAPSRRDDLPSAFRVHLGWLVMLEPVGADFRYRMIGSKVTEAAARDATGSTLTEAYGEADAAAFQEQCRDVLMSWQALFTSKTMKAPGRDFIVHESLALPLSIDGQTVDTILLRVNIVKTVGAH